MRSRIQLPLVAFTLVLGCGAPHADPELSPPAAPASSALAQTPPAPSCARVGDGDRPAPVDTSSGSAVALGRLGTRTLAYVADDDDRTLRTVDVGQRAEIASTPLAGAPAAALVLGDGRVAVSLRERREIVVLEPASDPAEPLVERCTVSVPDEPTGLATTPDGATVLVVSRWGHALTAFDATTFERRFAVGLPRDPRAVVASSDGSKAFVSHIAGAVLSVVDLGDEHAVHEVPLSGTERFEVSHLPGPMGSGPSIGFARRRRLAGQGYAIVRGPGGRILAPQVLTDPGNGVVTWGGYGDDITVLGDVLAIDEQKERRTVEFATARLGARDCLLPRAAAVDGPTGRLFVTCLGLDRVVAYDAKARSPHDSELGRLAVGTGATGIAIDPSARIGVVWSQFDQSVAFIDLDVPLSGPLAAPPILVSLERRSAPLDPAVALGRRLFHAAGDRRISFDGRSCASCHPDGRDDSITWTTPNGQRQTPMLVERLEGTEPFGWDGVRKTQMGHLARTLERLSGTGLSEAERQALLAYVAALRAPSTPDDPPSELVARGAEIFRSEETQCSTCHGDDERLTDRLSHDVHSHTASDFSVVSFDTPSLRFVGHSAPYFHDGRYATLDQVLALTSGTMGETARLSADARAALEAYLESL